jgi:hypothetical protein
VVYETRVDAKAGMVDVTRQLLFHGHSGDNAPLAVDGCGTFREPYEAFDKPDLNTQPSEYLDIPYSHRSTAPLDERAPSRPWDLAWVGAGTPLAGQGGDPLNIKKGELAEIVACAKKRVDWKRVAALRASFPPAAAPLRGLAGKVAGLAPEQRWFQAGKHFAFIGDPGRTRVETPVPRHSWVWVEQALNGEMLADVMFAAPGLPEPGKLDGTGCGSGVPLADVRLRLADLHDVYVVDDARRLVRFDGDEVTVRGDLTPADVASLKKCRERLDGFSRDFPLSRLRLEHGESEWNLERSTGVEHELRFEPGTEWTPERIVLEPRRDGPEAYTVEWQSVACAAESWWAFRRDGHVFSKPPPPDPASCGAGATRYRVRRGEQVLKVFTFHPTVGR